MRVGQIWQWVYHWGVRDFALIGAAYIATTHFPASRVATLIGATQMFGMAGGSAGQFVVGPAVRSVDICAPASCRSATTWQMRRSQNSTSLTRSLIGSAALASCCATAKSSTPMSGLSRLRMTS